jgi:fimbrial chaperone protein
MFVSSLHKKLTASVFLVASMMPLWAQADGGVVLGGTRIIYPAGQKESSISARNTSETSRYMVQSWVEDRDGNKTSDFIVTPPLYVSNPGSENTLRVMYAGPALPADRESVFYLTSKAIPAVDRNEAAGKNILVLAAATRIKLFVRPAGLSPSPDEAPSKLTFSRAGKQITITNPTPYFITLTGFETDGKKINRSVMVPPSGKESLTLTSSPGHALKYQAINDYGGLSQEWTWKF